MISFRSSLGAIILLCTATVANAQVIGVASNPQGSLYYSVGAAVAGVVQQKAGLSARVQPMSGSTVYAPLVARGQVEFGLLNVIDVVNAYEGIINFKDHKNPDLRLVGALFPIAVGVMVLNDSPIKSIKDLKGVRMSSQYMAGNTFVFLQDAILATAGLSIADMRPFPVADFTKGAVALGDGKVDATTCGVGTGISQQVNVALSSHGGIRFLPLVDTPEAIAAMKKVFPGAYPKVIMPAPQYPGVVAPTKTMLYQAFLVTSSHVPDDVVYKVTKVIYENKAMLEAASATMKTFDPSVMAQASAVPYHPGAEKFFKEAKQWPPKKL